MEMVPVEVFRYGGKSHRPVFGNTTLRAPARSAVRMIVLSYEDPDSVEKDLKGGSPLSLAFSGYPSTSAYFSSSLGDDALMKAGFRMPSHLNVPVTAF